MIIETGKLFEVIYLIVAFALTMYLTKTLPEIPSIRLIPAIAAIDEAVGRATELGRPVHVSSGMPQIVGAGDPMTIAGLGVVSHVAKLCARQDTRIIATAYKPEQNVMQMDVIRSAFIQEGKLDRFNPDDCLFLDGRAYEAGVMGLIADENCAANINVGYHRGGVALTFMPYAFKGDVIQIAGTAVATNLPHLAALVDYLLIAEDIFAADAYLTRSKTKLMALYVQDLFKYTTVVFVILASVLAAVGIPTLAQWLKL